MNFPQVGDIATPNVVTIQIEKTIQEALDLMVRHGHRDIIVTDERNFYLLAANDIIKLQIGDVDFGKKMSEILLYKAPTMHESATVLDALEYVHQSFDYICIVDEEGKLTGILSSTDVISSIDPETLIENYPLGELLKINKGVKQARPEEPLKNVLAYLLDNSSECVIVAGERNEPVGILTTRDILGFLGDKHDFTRPLREYMKSPVVSISEKATVKDGIDFIQKRHFRRVVVVDERGSFVGVINQKELISMSYSKWALLMKNHQSELKELNAILEKKAKQYQRMATIDPLTGLYNRYKLDELFELELFSMKKKKSRLCLAVLDIDFFKKINDLYGHDAGDSVLKKLSNLLLQQLRSTDTVARWGGEEFVLLLNAVSVADAAALLEKIREKVEMCSCEVDIPVTISIGVTEVQEEDRFVAVFGRADKAMYEAKKSGRNRVVTG